MACLGEEMLRPPLPGESWTTIDDLVREYTGVPRVDYIPRINSFRLYVSMINRPGFQYHHLNLELDGNEYVVGHYPTFPHGESDAERDLRKYHRLLTKGNAKIILSGGGAEIVALPKNKKKK